MENTPIWVWVLCLVVAIYMFIYSPLKKKQIEKEEKEKSLKKEKEIKMQNASKIQSNLEIADNMKIKLSEIQEIKITDISDYKEIIINNEKIIIEKGGNDLLFSLMKIDAFLKNYKESIVYDKKFSTEDVPNEIDKLKLTISKNNTLSGQASAMLEISIIEAEGKINRLNKLSHMTLPLMESRIKNLEYFKNIGLAMIVFYLNDKTIRFYEIYEAFEKLGIFDSTWQKSISSKLDNIEMQLAQISNQLTELNQNFITLVDSSENIVSELKEINSSIITNNMLQAITVYQTWRINKNTKSLRS
jgi:preprotein translocase subunit YajC